MRGRHLVLVDDNDDFRRSTEWLLDAEGILVTSYRSGLTALNALKELPIERTPSCLLLDVRMPDTSGPELHRRLMNKLGQRSHRALSSCLAEITDPVKERFRAES